MDTIIPPLEPLETATRTGTARADALVVAAWTDHHEELYAFLVRTTRSPEAAEDLLQESFLRLTREARASRAPDNVRAWLYRVAANLAVSRGRRLQSAVRWLTGAGARAARPQLDEAPETTYLARETRAELVRALDSVGPDARAALLLASEGFTGIEIAGAIGRSDSATRTLMSRARLRLRETLDPAEGVR